MRKIVFPQWWQKNKNFIFNGTIILLYVMAIEEWGWKGFWWASGLFMIVVAIRAWMQREILLNIMQNIEGIIWKKPLDKEYWKEGELKNLKVKGKW